MRQTDIETVSAIENRAYVFPWTPGIFRDCLRAGHQCWVLEAGSTLLGYGVLSAAAGEAHILNICIAPEYQGRGHGRRLLRRGLRDGFRDGSRCLGQGFSHGLGVWLAFAFGQLWWGLTQPFAGAVADRVGAGRVLFIASTTGEGDAPDAVSRFVRQSMKAPADLAGNGITVNNVAVPSITSSAYDAATGTLTVSGSGFTKLSGASNDIIASKFTVTGQAGATYTLTDTANVEITSGTGGGLRSFLITIPEGALLAAAAAQGCGRDGGGGRTG